VVDFNPQPFAIIREAFNYLRYRVRYRGSWVLEVRDDMERVVAERTFPNRSTAIDQFVATRKRLRTVTRTEIDKATLGA
jgi:hypothetical protein